MQPADQATFSPSEVARFDALARQWWDPAGPMRPLHAMNACRVDWIAARIAERVGAEARPRLLDLGCGGGLAAEALAQRGFPVLGLDAAAEAIAVAEAHAEGQRDAGQRLDLAYRVGRAEDLVAEGARFPVVTALEIIEHVPDPQAFLVVLAGLLEPGGKLFISTLNRTNRAWLTAKIGAEYVLRMLPAGTHDWKRFVTPAELAAYGRGAGLRLADAAGLSPGLRGGWRITRDLRVNYIAVLEA